MKKTEPNRSLGGTFIRDASGALLEHIPPTRMQPDAAPAAPPVAEGDNAAREADSGETAPPSFAGRHRKSARSSKE